MSHIMKYTPILTVCFLLLPFIAFGQGVYSPLVGVPGIDADANFNDYINGLYVFSISIAALLAVIKIIIAGVKWMMTDVVTSKGEAKKDIQGALLGLLIIVGAVLFLTVINPDLVKVNLVLPPAGTLKLDGMTSAAPSLTAPQSAYTTPSGSVITSIPVTASQEQKQLFLNQCQNTDTQGKTPLYALSSAGIHPRCITHGKTQTVTAKQFIIGQTNVEKSCTDGGGKWSVDTEVKDFGFCIK
ncbi:MAG: hypothetical protein RL097_304 [Candidatus Parcubacteria bacterium]|jgi:hypothetical protein